MRRRSSMIATFLTAAIAVAVAVVGDDWPQWRGPNRDGRWLETGVVDACEGDHIQAKWRQPVGPGYTSPTVAARRVYLSDRIAKPTEQDRILCFDAMTGAPLWQHSYDCAYEGISYRAGPRAAITIDEGKAYALGTMGKLHCLDAVSGDVLWVRDLRKRYTVRMPVWGISAAPLVVGKLLVLQIGGREGACILALDKASGEEVWRALDDRASYSAQILVEQSGVSTVVCWTGDRVAGMDPATGAVRWQTAFPETKRVIGVADPVFSLQRLFVSDFWEGSLMLMLDKGGAGVTELWCRKGPSERDTDALHAMTTTPIVEGAFVYGVDSYGELRCLDARTGDRVWESLELLPRTRWGTIHMVRNHDRVWMFTERGELAITTLSPAGLTVIGRAKLIEPTKKQHPRGVCWSHPAFANRHVYARNDVELVCADLSAEKTD